MASFINCPFHFCVSRQKPMSHLALSPISPATVLVLNCKKLQLHIRNRAEVFNLFVGKNRDFFGFLEVSTGKGNSWRCLTTGRLEIEGEEFDLEAEILEFMEKSSKPGHFPSKKELVEAGRFDLVEAIQKKGGWFSFGWESDEENVGEKVTEIELLRVNYDIMDFQRRVDSCQESGSLGGSEPESLSSFSARRRNSLSQDAHSISQSASSSGQSLEISRAQVNNSGVEGILSRLEKERNSAFTFDLGKSGYGHHASNKVPGDWGHLQTSRDDYRTGPGETNSLTSGSANDVKLSDLGDQDSHYTKPDMWRTWSLQRAGFKNTEFEAAEIPYDTLKLENGGLLSQDEIITEAADATKILDGWKASNQNQIRLRIQHLQTELDSALRSLRSRSKGSNSKEATLTSSQDLETLSDALEFQENEFMNSQERLRSIRANLAVLEGRMALAITDAQKILEEKQKRVDNASKCLQLLQTTSVVWTSSGSEVLLAGSFDGWTTQRKMEKSRTGTFSRSLMLYPGKYEIKFIVDGEWKIDPLLPIANHYKYDNNILIVP